MGVMNAQTAKEFLDEYVETVQQRDTLRVTVLEQAQVITQRDDALYKYFEMQVINLLYDAERMGVPREKLENLARVANNTVENMYREDDDE